MINLYRCNTEKRTTVKTQSTNRNVCKDSAKIHDTDKIMGKMYLPPNK